MLTLPFTVSGALVPVAIRLAPPPAAMLAPLLTTTSPLTDADSLESPEKVLSAEKLSPGVEAPDDESLRVMLKPFA